MYLKTTNIRSSALGPRGEAVDKKKIRLAIRRLVEVEINVN